MNLSCPQCGSKSFKRNGYTRHGKQNHRCLDCGRQFSLDTFYIEPDERQRELLANSLQVVSMAESSY
jgi:transposase-like protein